MEGKITKDLSCLINAFSLSTSVNLCMCTIFYQAILHAKRCTFAQLHILIRLYKMSEERTSSRDKSNTKTKNNSPKRALISLSLPLAHSLSISLCVCYFFYPNIQAVCSFLLYVKASWKQSRISRARTRTPIHCLLTLYSERCLHLMCCFWIVFVHSDDLCNVNKWTEHTNKMKIKIKRTEREREREWAGGSRNCQTIWVQSMIKRSICSSFLHLSWFPLFPLMITETKTKASTQVKHTKSGRHNRRRCLCILAGS